MDAARTGTRAVANTPQGRPLPAGRALLRPFPGLRYDTSVAGPLASLVAPPHTELGKAARAAFLASSPYVVTHLERPEYGGALHGPTVHRWLEDGVLVQDAPSLYVVRQVHAGRSRHFLLAELQVLPGDDRVHAHEGVFEQAVEARAHRLQETGVDSEPVLVVTSGSWPLRWAGDAAAAGIGTLVSSTSGTPAGDLVLEVWRLEAPDVLAALSTASAAHELLIADGHHRYVAVQRLAERTGRPQRLLVALGDEQVEPVDVRPLHRLLPGSAATVLRKAAPPRRRLPVQDVQQLHALAAGLEEHDALLFADGHAEVLRTPLRTGGAVGSGAWVDAVVRTAGVAAEDVLFESELEVVWRQRHEVAAAVLPRLDLLALQRIVHSGALVGRKTTSFRPKPLAGAVLRLR
ncbi:DUF1015 family protein [Kineococcus sp. T13]|uniref:DUF1015 family protein n=1 Tax=Kineococcus vitellinus TaxID=2696565 RepID=UPI0014121C3E|nr:DUF1015 family protein [Kineococcus vitellinus]